jgi:hypothetical protein
VHVCDVVQRQIRGSVEKLIQLAALRVDANNTVLLTYLAWVCVTGMSTIAWEE